MATQGSWTGVKVLVGGGCGFLGSYLVAELVAEGARVRVVDNLENGGLEAIAPIRDRVEWIEGDLRDRSVAERVTAGQDDGDERRLGLAGGEPQKNDDKPGCQQPVGTRDEQADAEGERHQHDVRGMVPVVIRTEEPDLLGVAQPIDLVASREVLEQAKDRQKEPDAEQEAGESSRGVMSDDDARDAPQHRREGDPDHDGGTGLVRRRREWPQRIRISGRDDRRELEPAQGRDGGRKQPEPGAGAGCGRTAFQEDSQGE